MTKTSLTCFIQENGLSPQGHTVPVLEVKGGFPGGDLDIMNSMEKYLMGVPIKTGSLLGDSGNTSPPSTGGWIF